MRASGILMPVFSLPGPFGIGTLGKEAFAFVDFLAEAKQTYWQILPIGPTGYGDSPYQSFSAFAGNPYFIDYRLLAADGLLTADEVPAARPVGPIDYGALYNERPVILKKAADRLLAAPSPAYEAFCEAQSFWLEDYALFMAVKAEQGQAGLADWPDDLRCRKPEAIAAAKQRLAGAVDYYKAVQFFFYTQWNALKAYANGKGVRLVGDIPIYVSPDSSDLWTHPELFQTDGQMHLTQVAGCPPDAFAADGQLWGNPLYDWPTHKATGFAWWKQRMKHATSIYDVVRIDHFRGFESYYSIPAGNKTAAGGHWEKGPDRDFINAMHENLGEGGIIAEDLGYLTPEVKAMLSASGYPGMKLLSAKQRYVLSDTAGVNEEELADFSRDIVHVVGRLNDDSFRPLQTAGLQGNSLSYRQSRIEELKEISGNRDMTQGGTAGGVTAASAIAALQEAGSKLSRDMLKSAYRAFAKQCYLIIELMRQFYDEQRVFRIVGESGESRFVPFSAQALRAVPGGSVGGVELGSREPIFDIVVSAAKKSTFSRLSQNETAKECYQLGFFKPENADAALAALEMMDFEGIEKVRQRVRQNGTLAQQLARMQQQMAQMAAVIAQQGTGPDEPARSAGGASAQKDGQAVKLAGLGNALPVAAAARAMDIH